MQTPAQALTVEDVNLLKDITNKFTPNALTFGNVAQDGNTITVSDISFTSNFKDLMSAISGTPMTDAELSLIGIPGTGEIKMTLDAVIFNDIQRNDDGSSVIQSVKIDGLNATFLEFAMRQATSQIADEVRLPNIQTLAALEGVELLTALSKMQADLDRYISSNTSSDFALSYQGTDVFTIASTEYTQTRFDEKSQYYTKFDGSANEMFIAGSLPGVPEYDLFFSLLKLDKITGSATVDGSWDVDAGNMDFKASLVLDNLATLETDMNFGGIDPALIEAFYTLDQEDPQQVLRTVAPMKMGRIGFKIINNSLFERGIEAAATAQGMSPELMLVQAESGATLGASFLAQISPELSNQATTAIKAFFTDPKSISLILDPEPDLGFLELFDLESQSPDQVVKKLNPSILANQ